MTMFEFGHLGRMGSGFCMDSWGAGPFLIEVHGKFYRFEDSDRFSPTILGKNGDPISRQPGERNPFWTAHHQWVNQGRRTADDGIACIYDAPEPTLYRKEGRRNIIVKAGEEGGDFIEVKGRPK